MLLITHIMGEPSIIIPRQKLSDGLHYETNKISAYMRAIGKLEDWRKWYVGQTGAIIEGKFVVYKTDVDRFLQGLPDFDLI